MAVLLFVAALLVFPVDRPLSDAVRLQAASLQSHAFEDFKSIFRTLGKGDVLLFVVLVLGACGLRRRAQTIALALLLSVVMIWPVKLVVGRERPHGGGYSTSFPSGDTTAVAAFAAPLAGGPPGAVAVAGVAVVIVGALRVGDGAHYPSDVLAGAAFGLLAGLLAQRLHRRWRFQFRRGHFALACIGLTAFSLAASLAGKGGRDMLNFLAAFGPGLLLCLAARRMRISVRRTDGIFRRFIRLVDSERGLGWRWAVPACALAAVLALYMFTTTRSTLWDRDEPRFSRATVEMTQSGNYVVPTFNGALRPDKPILIYWLMSLPVRVLGATEFASRFFAPIGTVLACLLTFVLGRRLFGSTTGSGSAPEPGSEAGERAGTWAGAEPGMGSGASTAVLAMLMIPLSPLMMVSGTAATTDAVLLACITGCIAVFARALRRGGFDLRGVAFLAFGLGMAQLVKGPVGLAIPVLSIGVCLLLMGRWGTIAGERRRAMAWAVVLASGLGTIVFLLWAIPANEATGGEFLRLGLGRHVVQRSLKPMESHGGSFLLSIPYYLPVLACGFFPWTLFLPGALSALFRGALAPKTASSFLVGWMVPTVVLMSLVATKLPHYILPVWPALALAVAAFIGKAEKGLLAPADLAWLKRGAWLFVPTGVAAAAALMVGPAFLSFPGIEKAGFASGFLLLTVVIPAAREHASRRYRSSAVVLVAGMLAFQFHAAMWVIPKIDHLKPGPPVARAVKASTEPGTRVLTCKFNEPSLNFYLDRYTVPLADENAVAAWARERVGAGGGTGGAGEPVGQADEVLVAPRAILQAAEERHGPLGFTEIASSAGFDFSKGRKMELVAVRRSP